MFTGCFSCTKLVPQKCSSSECKANKEGKSVKLAQRSQAFMNNRRGFFSSSQALRVDLRVELHLSEKGAFSNDRTSDLPASPRTRLPAPWTWHVGVSGALNSMTFPRANLTPKTWSNNEQNEMMALRRQKWTVLHFQNLNWNPSTTINEQKKPHTTANEDCNAFFN